MSSKEELILQRDFGVSPSGRPQKIYDEGIIDIGDNRWGPCDLRELALVKAGEAPWTEKLRSQWWLISSAGALGGLSDEFVEQINSIVFDK